MRLMETEKWCCVVGHVILTFMAWTQVAVLKLISISVEVLLWLLPLFGLHSSFILGK